MQIRLALAGIVCALHAACCTSGRAVDVWQHLATPSPPRLIVYYPEHGTLDLFMSTGLIVDGELVARLCEGTFTTLVLTPGRHVLAASTDDDWGCQNAPRFPWPPLELEIGDRDAFVRFADTSWSGADSQAPICWRHLLLVDEAQARAEVAVLELVVGRP